MPPKKNQNKGTPVSYYWPKKRKATSPIQCSERTLPSSDSVLKIGQVLQSENGQENHGHSQIVNNSECTPFQFPLPNSTFFDFNFGQPLDYNTTVMNFPPFGSQQFAMQSPPFQQNFSTQSVPQWVTELKEDIKNIKTNMSKLDKIENMVDKINSKVDKLENHIHSVDKRVEEVEKSTKFLSAEYDETKQKLKSAKDDLGKLENQCKEFEKSLSNMKLQNQKLEDKTNDLEFRGLRENLLFHGIKELPSENCKEIIKTFISDTLGIEENIVLDRAHRLGKPKSYGTRPIVAKFHSYNDRELVRITATEKAEILKASDQGVGVQQTKAVLQKRRDMQPLVEREKAAGRAIKWAGSKLLARDHGGQFREVTS